jgi:hypothetical protein
MGSENETVEVLGGYEHFGFMQSKAAVESSINVSTGGAPRRLFDDYSSYLHSGALGQKMGGTVSSAPSHRE